MKSTEILHNLRENFKGDLDYAKRRMARLSQPGVKEGAKRFATILKYIEKTELSHSHSVSLWDNTALQAMVYIETTSLKSPEVMGIMEFLEDIVEARSCDDHVSEWSASRTFNYRMDCLNLDVVFRLPTDGELCSRVQVGTKLQEVPVYKLQCA